MLESTTDFERLYDLIMGAWASQAVRALAELSVAEALADGPLGADALAEAVSADRAALTRLLRAAVSLGLAVHDPTDDTYAATTMMALLDGRSSPSLKHYAQAAIGPAFWLPALNLADAVRSGRPESTAALGCDVFAWMADHPEEAARFGAGMSDLSAPVIAEAVLHIETAGVEVVVDVGGAEGGFLAAVLEADPALSGMVLELPHAVASVTAEAQRRGLANRMRGIAGDFMTAVPRGDVFLLKFILHDWDDAACVKLLSHVRQAMRPRARLYIVEMTSAPGKAPIAVTTMDMAMLFSTGGQERELDGYGALLEEAGLVLTSSRALIAPYQLIEARSA